VTSAAGARRSRELALGVGDRVGEARALGRLHLAFFAAIDEPLEHEDPSDRLLDVESQLGWLRELGFGDVDCYWKWLEMALLIGVKPAESR